MFCPYKYDQQLQIISNIITKNKLKTFKWHVHCILHVNTKKENKKTCCPLYSNGSRVYSVSFRNKICAAQSNSYRLGRWL